jgi:hypothetical protein
MKTFLSYLRRHAAVIFCGVITFAVFFCVFRLYRLNAEAVLYAAALCAFFYLACAAVHYAAFRRKHNALREAERSISLDVSALPAPNGAIEQDYDRLIRTLYTQKNAQLQGFARQKTETDDYYSLWAHQIKTPIAASRLLLQNSPNENSDALMAELIKIEQYVDMALGYQRLTSDSSDLVLREYPLDDIIRRAVRRYARLFVMKKLYLDFRETELTVLTDEKWLCFALEQILSNAVKYTVEGGVTVRAEGVTLIIEDTGIGISAEDLPRVFEKGFTGYNGREDKKSTGIGLYLCAQTLKKLGHTISISSSPQRGTRVSIGLGSCEIEIE